MLLSAGMCQGERIKTPTKEIRYIPCTAEGVSNFYYSKDDTEKSKVWAKAWNTTYDVACK